MVKLINFIITIFLAIFNYGCKSHEIAETKNHELNEEENLNRKEYQLKDILTNEETKKIINETNTYIKKLPNIFIFWIDTLRPDYITDKIMPSLYKFSQNKDTFFFKKSYANATTTYFAATSFFFSILGHNRPYMINDNYSEGSLNLSLLKKLGYKLQMIGRPNNYFCIDKDHNAFTEQYNQNRFLFSFDSYNFIDYCNHYKKGNNNKNYAHYDHKSISKFKNEIIQVIKNQNTNNISLIFLDGIHAPYTWHDDIINKRFLKYKIKTPYLINTKSETIYDNIDDHEKIKNSYTNAAMGADYQFERFINMLKNLRLLNNSIIIVLSDHGERLFDKEIIENDKNKTGHSGFGYNVLINNVLIIKFPSSKSYSKKGKLKSLNINKNIMLTDVFPTIFDYLNIKYPKAAKKYLVGKSYFNQDDKQCIANYSPDWSNPPNWTFVTKELKAYVNMYRKNSFDKTVSFKILNFFDVNDQLLTKEYVEEKFAKKLETIEDEDNFIADYFKECLRDIVQLNN